MRKLLLKAFLASIPLGVVTFWDPAHAQTPPGVTTEIHAIIIKPYAFPVTSPTGVRFSNHLLEHWWNGAKDSNPNIRSLMSRLESKALDSKAPIYIYETYGVGSQLGKETTKQGGAVTNIDDKGVFISVEHRAMVEQYNKEHKSFSGEGALAHEAAHAYGHLIAEQQLNKNASQDFAYIVEDRVRKSLGHELRSPELTAPLLHDRQD
jgi:hypothetical protein